MPLVLRIFLGVLGVLLFVCGAAGEIYGLSLLNKDNQKKDPDWAEHGYIGCMGGIFALIIGFALIVYATSS